MNLEKFYLLGKDFINDFDEDYEDFADNMQNPEYAKEFRSQLPQDGVVFGGKEKKSQKIDLGQALGFTDEPRRLSNGVYIPSMTDYGIVMKNSSIDRLKHKPQVDIWDQLGQGVKRLGHDMTQQGQNVFNAFDYYGNTGDNNLEIHNKSSKISSIKEEYQDLLKTILTENPEFSPKLINELPQLKTIRETIKFLEDDLQSTIKSYTNEAVKKRDEFSLRDKNLSRMFELNPDADTLFSDVLGGIGTSIGLMAMSAPFGPASALAMTALGGLAEGQSMAQEVWNLTEGKGLTDEERTSKANAAFVAGNPIGWTEAVPLQRGINRIFKTELKKGWKDFAKKMALESLEEGIQEGFQTTAEEVTKASLIDEYKIQWNQIPYSALVGSLSGGVTSGGMYAANVATESYFELNDYINQQKKIVKQLHDSKVIDDKVYQSIKKVHKDKTRLDWKNDFATHQNNLESLSKTEKTINKIKAGEDLTSEEEIALKQSKSYEDALKETKDPKAAFEQVLGNIKALEVSLTNDEITELQKEMGTLESKRQDIKLEGRKALVENVFQDTKVYDNTLASISEKPNEWFLSQEIEEGTKFIGETNDLIVSKDKTAKVVDKQGTVVKEVVKPNFTSTLEDVKDVFEPVMPNPVTFHLEEDIVWLPTQNKVIENDVLESQKKHVQKVKTDTEIKLKEFEDTEVKESLLKFSKKIAYKANTTAKIDKVLKTKSVFQASPTEENLTQFASALVDFGIDPSTYIDPANPIESALKKVQNDKISVSESWIPVVIETSKKVIDTYFEVKASLFQSNKSKYSVAEEVYEDAMQISAEIEQAIRSMKDSNKNIEAELEFYLYEGEMYGTKDESIIEFFSELMLESFETNNSTDKLKSEIKNLTPVINSTIDRVWSMYQQAKNSDLIIMSGNFIISSIAQANILKKVFNVNYIKPDSELEFSGLTFISVLQYDRIMNGTNEEEKQKLKDADLSRLPNNAFNYLLDTPNVTSVPKEELIDISNSKGKKSPFFNKDIKKFSKANKLIAYGEPETSSRGYAEAVKPTQLNTGKYTEDDVVGVTVNGGVNADKDFERVKVEVSKAIQAGATIVADNAEDRNREYNKGERLLAEYLQANDYKENNGVWNFNQKSNQEDKQKQEVVQKLVEFLEKYGFEVKDADDLFVNLALKSISLDKSDLTQVAKALSEPLAEMLSYSEYFFEIQDAIKDTEYFKKIFEEIKKEFEGSTKKNFNRLTTKKIFKELLEKGFNEEFAKQLNINKTLLQKIKDFVTEIIAKLKDANWAIVDKNIQKIVENTFKSEEFIRLTPKKGYKQVDFQEAFDTNPLAKEIMIKIGINPNIVLTGSIAYATQGTIYRNINTIVHDLDLVNLSLTQEEINDLVYSNYPDAVKAYEFAESRYKVDTFLIPPAGYKITDLKRRTTGKITDYNVRNADNEIVGTFKLQFETSSTNGTINETEIKTGIEALYVDFFSGDTTNREVTEYPLQDGDKSYSIKLSHYESPFEAKLSFSRFKDIWDYNRFVPNRQKASNNAQEGQGGTNSEKTTKSTVKEIIIAKRGKMTFSYGNNKRSDIKSETTFDAILNGERTATTRYSSDGHMDYWMNTKVGDIIEWESTDGKKVLVRVTKAFTKIDNISAEEWSKKEGWSVEYFNSNVKPKLNEAYQMEYELVDASNNAQEAPQDTNFGKTTKSTSEGKKVSTGKFLPSKPENRLRRIVDDAKNWFNGWFVFDTVAYFGKTGFGANGVPAVNSKQFDKETVDAKELKYTGAILVDTLEDISQQVISYAQDYRIAIVTREQLQRLKATIHSLFKRTRIYASAGKGYYDNTDTNVHMADLTVSLYQNNLVASEVRKEEKAIEQGYYETNQYGKSEWKKTGTQDYRYYGMNLQVGLQENWQIHATALADHIIRAIELKKRIGENTLSINLTGNDLQYLNLSQEEVDNLIPKFLDEVFKQVQDKIQREGNQTKINFRSGLSTGMEEAMFKWAMNQNILQDYSMDIAVPSNYRVVKSDGTIVYDMEEFFGRFGEKQEVKQENPKLTFLNKTTFESIFNNKEDIKSSYGKDAVISNWTDFVLEQLGEDVSIRIVKSDFVIPNTKVNLVGKRAAYHRGTVYINEDIIETPLEMYREVSHELTHQFLNNLLDTNASFYNEMLVVAKDTFKFLRAHPEYIKNQADYDRILRYEATEQHKFVKEFVAYAMSNTSNLNQFMRMTEYKDGQSLWARFISKIKNFIRSFYGEQGKYPTLMQALENVLERRVGYKKNIQTMVVEPVLNEKDSVLLALTNGLIETDSFASSASVRSLGYEIAKANNIGLDDIPNGDHIAYLQTLTIQELQKQLYAVSGYRESLELIYEKSKKANEEFQDFEKAIITHIFNTINNLKRYNVIRPIGRAYTTPTGGKDYYYSIEELPLNYKDQEGTSKSSYFNDIRLNNTMEKLSNALGVPMRIAFVEQIEKIELNGKSTFEKVVRPGMNNSNNVNIISGKYLWIGNFGALNTAIAIEFNSEEDKLKVLDRLAQINEAKFGLDISESETRIERLAVVLRLMVEDIRVGGQVGESFEEETFVDNYKNTITRSTNMIKVFKRHYDLSPIFKPYYDKNKLDTFLSLVTTKNADQQPLGVVKGEKDILFNAFFFDSIESNPNAEMTVMVDGIEQKFLLKDILTNEFGKETTDGAIFYLEGTFDNVYREAFGVRKNGVIKAWGSDIEGMMPLQLKGAYHKVSDTPNNLLAQWMKQNNVSMLVSSSAIKVHGSPVTGQDYKISDINDLTNQKAEINQLPLSMFNRQSEKETYENEGTGLSSGLSRNLFTKYNSIFKNNELNSVLSKVLTRTKKNLDKALLSISDSGLIETAVSILEKPSGSKMEQLISKMIANVIMGRGLMTPSEYETLSDDFKVGQSRLQEEAFKEIGVIFHEPFFAKMFQTHIKKKINEYLGWDIPSYWGVIRPDTGYLEANHVETASRTLRLKLQRKKKNLKAKIDEEFDSEYLYDNKKNLEEIIDSIEDEEDLKQYKSELKDVDKKIADYERKINLLNINIEKEFNDRYEEMIDIKTGRLKEGWCFVSSDMAKALSPMNQDRLTNEPEIAESKLKMINDLSINQLIAEIFDIKGLNVDFIEAGDFSELAKASEGFKVLFNSPEYVVRELPVGNIEEITKLVRKTYPKLKIAFVGHVQTQEGINIALVDENGVVTLLEPNTGQSADIIKLIGRETLKFRNTTYNQRVTSETIDDLNDKLQGKDLIATAIPTDSIFSQQPVRIAGVLDDIESSSVIVDSNHWQTRAGKDYDIDTLLFTYYDPKYWKNSNYKAPEELSSYEKAKAEYQNSHFMTVVRALRDGKKNLIKKMMSSYQERIPTEKIDTEEKLYRESIQVKYVQSFLETTKGGDLSKLSEELFKLLDMYPKKVGGLIKEKAFYTFLGQLGLKTKISVSVPKTILDIYHSVTKEELNSTVEVDVDPTDSKRVTDMSMLFQRLLNDMVDKPTNTNSLYYEYEPDSFRMMTLKYGGNALPIVQKLEYFLKRNYYSILESGSDETIISSQEAGQIEDFLGYLKGTLPKSITAGQEIIFGNPFNARKDVHSINPDARFTFHELLKQIKEQRYINKLLKEKNFDKLNEFALASMKEKINRSNFQQADQTVVSQFYNNISSIDNIDEVPIMNMYDGIDLNMIPELTVSLNDYVVWMKDYKKMINSVVVNRTSNTIPNFTIYDILVQLNSILKEAIRSTDNLEDNVSYLLTKYFFMPNGQEIQSWTSEDIYKQRELHRLKAGIIAILGAPNWTGFANNYWKMLGQELRMLKAWANGYAANKQEGKDNELSPIKEIQHAYLENFDDIFDLVLKSKRTFPNEGGINHIGKEYKDGDKLKPFKIKAFKGLKEGQELWIYPYKEGMGFVIKETIEGKVKNTFVYKNPQELYLAANESDYTASQIIEEIKKNAKRAMFNKEGAIEQRRNYNFNAFDNAYTEMFLFFNSFYFQTSVALEYRMELAIRKINEFSVNNPSKQVGLNYALRTLFSIPTNYTAHNSIKVFQKSNYADMLSPYDKYSDNTLIWELILNTKPELASEIAKEQSSIYTGETLTASQKVKTSIQQLMADDEVYFDVEPENKTPFLPGEEYSIKRNGFDPKNLQSAIDMVSKDWFKSAKRNDYDINLSESDLTNDQIMNSALGFEFPNLLGQELFLPIRIKDVINIFSGSEIITNVKGLNFSQILIAKQKFFMEINRQVTAMENRVNTLIDKEIKVLALNWKTENPTVLKKLKSFFNKSKENLNADIVTSIATRVKENPYGLEIIFDQNGNALYQRGEVIYNNIEDYINSLGLETSTEKALERASALYRLKYSQYARVADRMVSYIDAKILQYEQFLTDAANRTDTDNGAYGILTLLRGYKKRYVAQSKKLKNNFYPLSIPINELEHLYTVYEETKVDNFLSERWNSEYWQQFYNNFEDFKRDILFYEEQYAENFANIPEDLSYLELQMISEAVNLSQLRKPLKQYPNDIRKIALEKGWQNEVHLDLIYGMKDFVKWFWDNKIQEKISIKSLKGVQKFHNIMFGSLHNDLSYFNWLEYAYWENNKNGREKNPKLMSNLKRFMAMQSNSKGIRKEMIPLSKVKKGDTISFTYLYEYYDEGTTQTYSVPKVVTGVVREVKGSKIKIENEKKSLQGLSELEMLERGYTRILFEEGEEFTVDDIIAKQYQKHEAIKNSQEPITQEQTDMLYDLVKLKFLKEEDIAGYRDWTQGYASSVILPAYIEAINFRWRDTGYDKVKVTEMDYEEIAYEYMTEEFFEVQEKKIRRRRKFLTSNIDGKEEPMVTRLKSEAEPDKRSFWQDKYKILQMLSSIWFLGGFKSGQQNWIDGSSQLIVDLGVINWFKARWSGYTRKRKASLIEKIEQGDYTEMDNTLDKFLNQDSFTPENFDKMKLVEALTLQYVLKHDLGEQGLQASFIQDVEGGFLGKVAYTAKGFLYIFKEAEVMVRRKAAFYYSYKAVMIDGITDPNMAELVIEKGVSRTQSLYDVLYRRLGEDTDLGKLLFQFSQYGHFQWELLKQDYRISKHLDEKFKLSAYFKALLYGQHSINANRKVKYAQKLTYDVLFQTLALFFPGMRLGGAMNRTAIFMLRALITALIDQDDDETKKTTEDWINSILAIMFGIGVTYPLNFAKRMIVPEKYFVEVEDENGKVELEQREKNMYESIRDNEMSFSRSAVAPSWWALGETVGKLAFKEKKYGEADRLRGYAMYKITPFNILPYRNRYMSPKEREMGNYGLEERIFGEGFGKPTRLLEGMLPTNKFYLTSTKEEEKELKKLEEEVSKPEKGSIEEKMQKAEKKKKSKEKKSLEEKLQEKQNKK